MNKPLRKGVTAPLNLMLLVIFLALPGVSAASSKLTFAFSEASPPYSSSSNEKAVGLFPDLVQPAEDARFAAQQLGYSNKLKIRKVDFIPNSQIPFHIGVSRKLPFAMEVIDQVDAIMQNPEFQSQQNTLIENYR